VKKEAVSKLWNSTSNTCIELEIVTQAEATREEREAEVALAA
jgi:hypothetical protein